MPRTGNSTESESNPLIYKPKATKWSFGDCYEQTKKILPYLKMFSVYVFTDWPCETVKYLINTIAEVPLQQQQAARQQQMAGQQGDAERQLQDERPRRCTFSYTLWLMLAFLRLSFIIVGAFIQLATCSRRDTINVGLIFPIDNSSTINCKDERGLLIPDGVIILVAIWVYFGLKFGHRCTFYQWKELKTVLKADTAERLNALIEDVKSKLQKKSIIAWYTVIPLMYIVLSQVTSVMYLVESFMILFDGDVLALLFFGFISFDLLYLCVIMRYAYRCQMIIYYLQIIKKRVKDHLNDENNPEAGGSEGNQLQDQKARSHQEMMKEVTKAHEYIKDLNANSATTGFIILIAGFQLVNCALVLLGKDKLTKPQIVALSLRFALWGFLVLFPFQKAGGVNIASKKLCKTGLDMCSSYNGMGSSLKARMFGISMNPWLPYVVVILLLLALMVGSKYKSWYEYLHLPF